MPVDAPLPRALVEQLAAGVYMMDTEGRFVMVNPAAERLLGWRAEDLVGRPAHETIHSRRPDGGHHPADACLLLGVLRDGRPATCEEDVFVRRDGSLLPVTWTAAPLVTDGGVTGAATVFVDATHRRRHGLAQAAQLERERQARAEAEEAFARLALLNEVSHALTSTLDVREALARLGRLVVPAVGDWCVIDLLVDEHSVERLAVVHRDPPLTPPGRFEGLLPPVPAESRASLARVLRGSGAILLTDIDLTDFDDSELGRKQHELFTTLAADTAVVVPLRARRHVLGAMTLVRVDPARPLTRRDVVFADELGRSAGLLLDNARLYNQQREAVATLQRSLLSAPPAYDDLQIEVRYLPANEAAEIGGDWYDAFPLATGQLAVAIGDVVGHDIEAAARMAQLRNLLRGVAYHTGEPPSRVLGYLNRILQGLDVAELATAIYGLLRPVGDGEYELRWSNAGHPPPLVVPSHGDAELLDEPIGLLLGIGDDERRPDSARTLTSGTTLIFYTDGLVENRDEQLDAGLTRLRQAGTALRERPLGEMCDALLTRLVGGGTNDDVALIAVRLP